MSGGPKIAKPQPFEAWIPLQMQKGMDGVDGAPMRVEGIISSEGLDADGEMVLQDGLILDYFMQKGWINDNHDQSSGAGLGYPIAAERIVLPDGKQATKIVAEFVPTQRARDTFELIKASQGVRDFGFSVEGGIIERNGIDGKGKIIRQAIVRDVSLTRHPKNPDCTITNLVKSLQTGEVPAFWKSLTAGDGNAPGDVQQPLSPQSMNGKGKKKKDCKKNGGGLIRAHEAYQKGLTIIQHRHRCGPEQAKAIFRTQFGAWRKANGR